MSGLAGKSASTVVTALMLVFAASIVGGCAERPADTRLVLPEPTVERDRIVLDAIAGAASGGLTDQDIDRLLSVIAGFSAKDPVWVRLEPLTFSGVDALPDTLLALRHAGVSGDRITMSTTIVERPENTGDLLITVDRYRAVVEGCPDWSEPNLLNRDAVASSNFGCARARNLGAMITDAKDLRTPRGLGPAYGPAVTLGVDRYRRGEVRELPDNTFNSTE